MVATVESAFVLLDRASGPVKNIRREVRGLERDARKAGRALDDMAGPRVARDIDRMADETRGLRTQMRDLPRDTRAADRAVGALDRTVVRAGTNARRTSNYYAMLTDRTKLLAAASVAALPVVQAVGGAVTGLAGSLYGAGLGAGAVGLAGGGTLAVGLGSVIAVAKPAQTALKEATKAQEALTEARREFGRSSKEATAAEREFERALRGNRGLERVLRERRALAREWRTLTAAGRQDWFGLQGDIAQITRRAAPRMAHNANAATGAVRRAGTNQARFLAGDFAQDTLATLTREFVHDLPIAERTLQNVEVTVGRIATAALPFFREGVEWVEDMTMGWRRSTQDAAGLRREIGGFVDDLKAWGDMTGSALELVHDLFMGSRPAGRTMVEDFTATLDRWDRWVERNPDKVSRFFTDAAQDTERIADALGDAAKGLHDMATDLRPLIGPMADLVSLMGGLASTFGPGGLAVGLMGWRRGRNALMSRGAGAAPGMAAGAPGGAGAGAGMAAGLTGAAGWFAGRRAVAAAGRAPIALGPAYGDARRARIEARRVAAGLPARSAAYGGPILPAGGWLAPRGPSRLGGILGPRLSAGGTLAMRGAGAAGRFAGPAAAILAASDFALTQGTFGERVQGALSGATLGLIPRPQLGTGRTAAAGNAAGRFMERNVAGLPATAAGSRQGLGRLDTELARLRTRLEGPRRREIGDATGLGIALDFGGKGTVGAERDELRKRIDLLERERTALAGTNREMEQAERAQRNEKSRERAYRLLGSFGEGYDVLAKAQGPDAAMDKTLKGVYQKMRGMRRTGARILGENTLAWAQEMADKNPALQDEVDRLARRIERRFSRMGDRVRVVNGQILSGSRAEWNRIADAMVTPAERARQEVSAAFTDLQEQAIGSLEAMGFSRQDARNIVRGLDAQSGPRTRRRARNVQQAGPAGANATLGGRTGPSQASRLADATGDGIGVGEGLGNQGRSATAARQQSDIAGGGTGAMNLMGAKPGLSVYAEAATGMGLRVSSGHRGGAITSSGNQSYHATGDALDLAGPPDAMMRFAQYAAQTWGSHLEELIYTPLGRGQIKDGQPYVYSGQVAADHHDHVHIADTAPTGAGGGFMFSPDTAGPGLQQISLDAARSGQGGVPGAMANAAMGAMTKGMEQQINAMLAAGATPGADGAAGGSMTFEQVARLAESVGLPGITFAQIAKGESGFNPRAVGNDPGGTHGLGLWQITTGFNDDVIARFGGREAMFNPRLNALAAKAIYDRQGIRAWYGTRYMTGTNLHFTGDGPGRPRLSGGSLKIRRTGDGVGRGGAVVHFNPQIAVNGSDRGALRSELRGHFDRFADMIVEEISSGREESSMELIS